jgi:hypothetical protein
MDEILGSGKEPAKSGNGKDPGADDSIQTNDREMSKDVEFADEMDAIHRVSRGTRNIVNNI